MARPSGVDRRSVGRERQRSWPDALLMKVGTRPLTPIGPTRHQRSVQVTCQLNPIESRRPTISQEVELQKVRRRLQPSTHPRRRWGHLFFADFLAAAVGAAFLAESFFFAGAGGATFLDTATAFLAARCTTLLADAFLAADCFFAAGAFTTASGALTLLLSTRNLRRKRVGRPRRQS